RPRHGGHGRDGRHGHDVRRMVNGGSGMRPVLGRTQIRHQTSAIRHAVPRTSDQPADRTNPEPTGPGATRRAVPHERSEGYRTMAKESTKKSKIRPLDDRVVIQQIEAEEKTAGGIVLPDTAKEKPQRGRVIAVGPGKLLDSGERAAIGVVEGDEVLF